MSSRIRLTGKAKIIFSIIIMTCLVAVSVAYICILLPVGLSLSSITTKVVGRLNRNLWKLLKKEDAVISLKEIDVRAQILAEKLNGGSPVVSKLPLALRSINTWQEARTLESTLRDNWPTLCRISSRILPMVKRVYYACPRDLQNKVVIAWARLYYLKEKVVVKSRFIKLIFEQFLKNNEDLDVVYLRRRGKK